MDPGHPSEVGIGTRGKKVREVDVVWQVAVEVKKALEKRGVRVILTKSSARQRVANRDRAEIANQAGADLFVRIHCDAASRGGFATFFPDRPGKSNGAVGPSKSVCTQSALAAKAFHRAAIDVLAGEIGDRGLHGDRATLVGKRQGALTGSIYSKVPVLLAELCVLTKPKDERFIASKKGFSKMCKAMEKGVLAALDALAKRKVP